jgi:hypothetical protein
MELPVKNRFLVSQKNLSKCLGLIFSLLFLNLQISPAHSQKNCTSIKSEVISLEKIVQKEWRYFSNFDGKLVSSSLQMKIDQSIRQDNLGRLGKLMYNNSRCFTQSQNDQIREMRYWLTKSIVTLTLPRTRYYGNDCANNSTRQTMKINGKSIVFCEGPKYQYVDMPVWKFPKSIYGF